MRYSPGRCGYRRDYIAEGTAWLHRASKNFARAYKALIEIYRLEPLPRSTLLTASSITNRQSKSSFLTKLPIEIRSMIYREVFFAEGHVVHTDCRNKKDGILSYTPCLATSEAELTAMGHCPGECYDAWVLTHRQCQAAFRQTRDSTTKKRNILNLQRAPRSSREVFQRFLPLLLTCRQIHWEAQVKLYAGITFILNSRRLAYSLKFIRTISLPALHSLRTLYLVWCSIFPLYLRGADIYPLAFTRRPLVHRRHSPFPHEQNWEAICRELATATNLRTLYIKVIDVNYLTPEEEFIAPLRELKIANLTVEFPWPKELPNTLASDEVGAMRIRRPRRGEEALWIESMGELVRSELKAAGKW